MTVTLTDLFSDPKNTALCIHW